MSKDKKRKIYGLASVLGIDRGDELHSLVLGLTGEEHISNLDESQYHTVLNELYTRLKLSGIEPPPSHISSPKKGSRGMSKDQQCMVWYLMYQLKALDQHPRSASLGERLRGIIKRELHVDVTSEQPFLWLDYQQGSLLIERLKKYVSSAARKRRGDVDGYAGHA